MSREISLFADYHQKENCPQYIEGTVTLNDGVKYATRAHKTPSKWLDKVRINSHGAHPFQALSPYDQFTEALMVGLRLSEGVRLSDLSARTGHDWRTSSITQSKLTQLCDEGVLLQNKDHITATVEGRLRLNAVLGYLL